ncbi:amino acid ABC transporter substrate-binding protein [Bordetella holmesii]|uniref:General L-amino acid-binding periplasmic protein AapJ n=2 Tax=Bordetella holmesii TaxID=35814 RepID=A0A158M7Z8_9BORD|nr:amino acid ABC transporter substrate-binding protein [Bordetella holmesii]AHV94146.1 bacterial extracellular solute-binding s, 3 family protein [Bordetella holmesii ATCC 51541]AIT25862.1 bacterial extracellular solute-binding s, 3 family protein [Bordetella holmesii 44057]EWM42521.1 bacterial extracellular solute-binding s, 3 family protein [Bordetella holmesii 41130]EWM46430.1 bacterial extracellular solute-binding s, 3 family protein [Bordetella holmesii 35009]EWM50595.1 bacterial extrace
MKIAALVALGALSLAGVQGAQGATLDVVKKRGQVVCGTTTGFAGFSAPDAKGVWQGLDVDLCRAVAAAVFGDADKIKIVPLNSQQRFTALQSGEVDVLTRNTTVTQQRDTALGITHAGINFYDGQGFLVPKKLGVKSAKDLNGATICLQTGTSNENTLADWARANKVSYKPVVIETFNEVVNAFASGRCDVFSTDASGLASIRISKLDKPDDYVVLPEIISKEPLGPFVRQGDDAWLNVVRWTLSAMIEAEEYGLTSANVDEQLKSENPNVRRILGVTPGAGANMGLDEKWAYNIVKQVGNYGESFDRNVGKDSPLKISRGLNSQWTQGGLMYTLPIR